MSGYANINAYADPNVLLQTQGGQAVTAIQAQDIANQYAPQRNQLFISGEQQKQGANDIAMVGQAAQGLLALPDETARAAAYPGVVANLQRDGYAKNAPASYMGEAGLRQIVAQSLPVAQQYNLGLASSPGWDAAVTALKAPLPGQPGYGGGSGAAAAPTYTPTGTIEPDALTRATAVRDGLIKRGLDPDTATAFAANALHESAANPNVGSGDAGASHGLFQWRDDRATAYQQNFGHSPDNAPLDEQLDNVVRELSTTEGAARDRIAAAQGPAAKAAAVSQYYLRPKDVVPEMQRRGGTALQLVSQLGGSGQPAGGGQVILGDSYASKDGLGGSGVVGAQPGNARPTDVLSQIQRQAGTGALRGKDVVISTGAVNAGGDTSRVAEQIQTAKDAGAKSVTVVGAVDTPQYTQTNQQLQQIAQARGARFVPAGAAGADGVHPANYAPLRQAVAGVQPPPADGRYQVASNAPVPPPTSTPPSTGPIAPPAGAPVAAGPDATAAEAALGLPPRNAMLPAAPPAGAPPAATAPAAPSGQPPPQATGPIRSPADVPAPGQVGGIPTGQASVQYQQAQELMRRALAIEASGLGATPRGKAMADWAKGQAQLILQTDSVVTLPDGTQLHPLSGKIDNAPKKQSVWKLDPNAGGPGIAGYIDTQGGEKPEIVPAQRADAEAQQLVMTLGPKVADGTATPQERASYGVALETYRHPTVVTDPITRAPTRVYERNAPNFGGPTGGGTTSGGQPGEGAQPLTLGVSPQQQDIERNPAQAKVADTRYDRDAKNIDGITTDVRQLQDENVRVQEMQNIIKNISTGPGTEGRTQAAAWLQRWLPAEVTGWKRDSPTLDGADAAQVFQKLAFQGSVAQEKGSDPRGGYNITKLFQNYSPGSDLLNLANKNLLDMQLIKNQAKIDYNQQATDHFNTQEQRYNDTHKYDSLNVFDGKWNNQRNPQVYAAAMAAAGGLPAFDGEYNGAKVKGWTTGLSDDEYARALQIVSRADPSAVVNGKNGRISMQPKVTQGGVAAAPGDRVLKFDHSGNPIP